eukprot:Nk52_evm88s2118 gene=Nk52_evmTU88s2118
MKTGSWTPIDKSPIMSELPQPISARRQSEMSPRSRRKLSHKEDAKMDKRKSVPLTRGLPKKGGAGGKGTWGKAGDEGYDTVLDVNDPNYDEEEVAEQAEDYEMSVNMPTLKYEEFSKMLEPTILDYFEHGDVKEVVTAIRELKCSYRRSHIVVLAVNLAIDRKDAERELVSNLIATVSPSIVNEPMLEAAFVQLLDSLQDTELDCPKAVELIAKFLARAVADDCLPPAFVTKHLDTTDSRARDSYRQADVLLNMKHGYVRLDLVWGASGGRKPVKLLIKRIGLLLAEYISSGDMKEAERCIKDLAVPHFHHEIVFEAICLALTDNKEPSIEKISKLLGHVNQSGLITTDQMSQGFQRCFENIQDLRLDIPNAPQLLDSFLERAVNAGYVHKKIVENAPSMQRKRYVSQGDGGAIKAY